MHVDTTLAKCLTLYQALPGERVQEADPQRTVGEGSLTLYQALPGEKVQEADSQRTVGEGSQAHKGGDSMPDREERRRDQSW